VRCSTKSTGASGKRKAVALAWLLRRSPLMLPIPGTSSVEHLEENIAAATVHLTDEDTKDSLRSRSWSHRDEIRESVGLTDSMTMRGMRCYSPAEHNIAFRTHSPLHNVQQGGQKDWIRNLTEFFRHQARAIPSLRSAVEMPLCWFTLTLEAPAIH